MSKEIEPTKITVLKIEVSSSVRKDQSIQCAKVLRMQAIIVSAINWK